MKNMMDDIVRVIEEQAETIMRQADMIYRLSLLLLQHCEVTMAELESITERKDHEQNLD